MTAIERLTADIYDSTGTTLASSIPMLTDGEYRDEVSQRGNAKLRLPLDDAADLAYDSIIKFSWRGSVRFGCLVNSDACPELTPNGRAWLSLDNLPGLLALLDQAELPPEYGLGRRSGDTRYYGFMSKLGDWFDATQWAAPFGVNYTAAYPTNLKRNRQDPALLKYSGLQWIAPDPGPNVGVPGGTIACFRATATVTDPGDYAFITVTDDYGRVFCDGESVWASNRADLYAWRTAQTQIVSLAAGTPLIAISVENRALASSGNVLALAFVLIKVDDNGDPTGSPILVSNDTDWICTTDAVGWHRGQVILDALTEAQDAGYPGALALTATFTSTDDSNGDPFGDTPGEYSFGIETTTVADLIVTLCENGINAHVNADAMTLDVFNRMGSDKHATVEYQLAKDGGSLLSYATTGVYTRATTVAAHLDDGTWEVVNDTAGIAAAGLRGVGYSYGTAANAATARQFGREQLAESAKPQHQFTANPSTLTGPQFYTDVDLGDSVKAPADRNIGTAKARALAVTVTQNGQRVEVKPELMEDFS